MIQPQLADTDVIVAGLGPAGLAAALALADLGLRVVAVGHPPGRAPDTRAADTRAAALMAPSVTLLENLGVWAHAAVLAQPLTAVRIVDATGRLLRAPETVFAAADLDLESFGACIANSDLVRVLLRQARLAKGLTIVETTGIDRIEIAGGVVAVTVAQGARFEGRLLVGADGRLSPSRLASGITASAWTYPQTALACTLRHHRPHHGTSIEFHRPNGPLTTVPLVTTAGALAGQPGAAPAGGTSSLVWVEAPREAERLMSLDDPAFIEALRQALHGVLGRIDGVSTRAAFPLTGLRASRMAENRTALVGEAAHVMPPIGAQGLNLGLRDVAALADAVADGLAQPNADIGGAGVLQAYAQARTWDVRTRIAAVDLLNRSLLSAQLPVQAARGFGLHLLAWAPRLRRPLMRHGLTGGGELPRLMRPRDPAAMSVPSSADR